MSKFLSGIKGKDNKAISPQDIDALAETLHAPKITPPSVPKAKTAKPKAVPTVTATAPVEDSKKSKRPADTHRLTIDIPNELIEQMKKDSKRRGQTLKGFIVAMIYDFYEKE